MDNQKFIENPGAKNKRMEKAIEVSAKLFLKQGIEPVKMTDIADASGIGVATLYRYYGAKTGMVIAAMTYLWERLKSMFDGVFEAPFFVEQTGLKQLEDLMRMYLVLYEAHSDFMRLLAEFDQFIVREQVPKAALYSYENAVINFYPLFETAYKKGMEDGTVRDDFPFPMFYLTYAHAMMELTKKLLQGELLPSDDFSRGKEELEMMIQTAKYFIRKAD